ncbi:MAG: hypothetical protein K9I37_05910 [Crocinitomicaceae bacterium]|nr:hypothetical protein [Crocinitomicaceae bacterium]
MFYTKFLAFFQQFLSPKAKKKSEGIILTIAIASFLIHLVIIFLVDFDIIHLDAPSDLLANPIVAIYTPFSFILLYEVYLLIYYLPKSFTTYISKQYEIMTLIVIRRLFKDFSGLSITPDWFSSKYDLQFTYDLASSLILFFLIYLFYIQSKKQFPEPKLTVSQQVAINRFVGIKKIIANFLVPVFLILAIYSLTSWLFSVLNPGENGANSFVNINNIFFEHFFTVLIFADVLILLYSFFIADDFHKVMRNSGFIISTILIRLSFSNVGLLNNLLIICAIVYGLFILIIHNKYQKFLIQERVRSTKS